ncbi:hypothetical protein SAMN05892877_116102 [Rhizobium subbaraonis]|uniref:Uncharacterized protein n=1 Tax=Rhizobium subbaraonis TaxID=908946 RepID=A0A285UW36_9HYPH|nr:hypothetical protein SAMN05892877_116102 [Rhizobium subbaraonis]
MEKREVLCVGIHIADEQVKKCRLNEEFSFYGGINCCIEYSPDRINVETPAGNSSAFVFERRRQAKGLREILLMNSHDAAVSVASTIEPRDQKDVDASDWEERDISGRKPYLLRKSHYLMFESPVVDMVLVRNFQDMRRRRASTWYRLGQRAVRQESKSDFALHACKRGGVIRTRRQPPSLVERVNDRDQSVVVDALVVFLIIAGHLGRR